MVGGDDSMASLMLFPVTSLSCTATFGSSNLVTTNHFPMSNSGDSLHEKPFQHLNDYEMIVIIQVYGWNSVGRLFVKIR